MGGRMFPKPRSPGCDILDVVQSVISQGKVHLAQAGYWFIDSLGIIVFEIENKIIDLGVLRVHAKGNVYSWRKFSLALFV